MTGAGLYLIAIIASLGLGFLYFVSFLLGFKVSSKYLFVIKFDVNYLDIIEKKLSTIQKYKIKSKTFVDNTCELIFESPIKDNNTELLNKIQKLEGVISASVISYQNDFGD